MNLKEIKEIISLMNENGLAEVEVERQGARLKIRKAAPEPVVSVPPAAVPQAAPTAAVPPPPQESSAGLVEIKSPMVGTFYRAPSPESPPFVEVGQTVEVGQVVCIVEAMKLMNEIKSEVRGRVAKVLVENAEPVEFGQVLFQVEPV